MKRLLLLSCTLCLVLATSAPAFISDFSGTAGGTGTVDLRREAGHQEGEVHQAKPERSLCQAQAQDRRQPDRARDEVLQLPITCNEGNFTITLTKSLPIPIVNGKFSHTGVGNSGGTITLTGQFARWALGNRDHP